MEKENISNEDLVYEEIKQELLTPKKRKKIILKPREEFLLANHNWIDFLNDYHDGKCLVNKEVIKAMDAFLSSWQSKNCSIWYDSFQDFLSALAMWMYENLKAISRGGKPELIDIENFGTRQVNEILSWLQPVTLHKIENNGFLFYDNWSFVSCDAESKQAMICLAKILLSYITYLGKYCNGTSYYKVAICPYKKREKKECGVVFVGRQKNVDACEKHQKLWGYMKYEKTNRIKTKAIKNI